MVQISPKFEISCFNYPNWIEAVGIYPNVSNCIQITMKRYILPRLEWSCWKLLKIQWSCLKSPNLN